MILQPQQLQAVKLMPQHLQTLSCECLSVRACPPLVLEGNAVQIFTREKKEEKHLLLGIHGRSGPEGTKDAFAAMQGGNILDKFDMNYFAQDFCTLKDASRGGATFMSTNLIRKGTQKLFFSNLAKMPS